MLRDVIEIDGEPWVVIASTRSRKTLKRADSELHASRLRLGLTQVAMAKRLKTTQPTLCKMELGQINLPDDMNKIVGRMLDRA